MVKRRICQPECGTPRARGFDKRLDEVVEQDWPTIVSRSRRLGRAVRARVCDLLSRGNRYDPPVDEQGYDGHEGDRATARRPPIAHPREPTASVRPMMVCSIPDTVVVHT